MARFRNFLKMASRERRLLLFGAVVVACVRVLLWLLPLSRLVWLVERTALRSARAAPVLLDDTIVTVSWAVTTAARYVPRATCLAQALAAQWLLAWFGHPTVLRIGVAKANDKSLRAHAWLESEGRVVVGGESLEQDEYALLLPPASGVAPNRMSAP